MTGRAIPSVLLFSIAAVFCYAQDADQPPLAKARPFQEDYFGSIVSDPYRYLENLKDEEVQRWFKAQSNWARKTLMSIPRRQFLVDKMNEFATRTAAQVNLLNVLDNDLHFYLKRTPADETGKLYCRDGYEGAETLLFDPQTLAQEAGQRFEIIRLSPSFDGKKVALAIRLNGSGNHLVQILNVENRQLFPERIDRCFWPNLSWLKDSSGFFYTRFQSGDIYSPDQRKDGKSLLHVPGEDPARDREVFSRSLYPDYQVRPEEIVMVDLMKECDRLFATIASVDNRLRILHAPLTELKKAKIEWQPLFEISDEVYGFQVTDKDIYVFTPKNAANYQIVKTQIEHPDLAHAEIVVPVHPQEVLMDFALSSNGVYFTRSHNAVELKLYHLPKNARTANQIMLPFPAGSGWLQTKGFQFADVWVTVGGWTRSNERFRVLPGKNEFKPENLSSLPDYPEYKDLTVEELMIPARDGEEVPLSLIYRKGLLKNGKNRVFIKGYGAYGIPYTPEFNPNWLLWVYEGGIYAYAHVRGGGERGDPWYKAGYKTTKPNTWRDLIDCAAYLVKQNYTSETLIAADGVSAGGIMIGRAMTERPQLFAAAIAEVGLMNTLRLEAYLNGPVNAPEFGTIKDKTECMGLMEMDSYLHVRDGVKYPATLITAGMNDTNVIAWQPAKYAARLQAVNRSDKPVLFLVDYESGHGAGSFRSKQFENAADILSFALWQTGHPQYQLE